MSQSDFQFCVNRAEIDESLDVDKISSFVVCRVGNDIQRTPPIRGRTPEWNKTFTVSEQLVSDNSSIIVELWSMGFLWDDLLGVLLIPTSSIKNSKQEFREKFHTLYSSLITKDRLPVGVKNETKHKIWIDASISSSSKFIGRRKVGSILEDASLNLIQEDGGRRRDGRGFSASSERFSSHRDASSRFKVDESDRSNFDSGRIRKSFQGSSARRSSSSSSSSGRLKRSGSQMSRIKWIDAIASSGCPEDPSHSENKTLVQKDRLYETIERTPDLTLPRRTSMAFTKQPADLSYSSPAFIKFPSQDEELMLHVYKKSLQAMLCTNLNSIPHNMEAWSAATPTFCSECEGFLWGQGFRCTECGLKSHDKCKDLLNVGCSRNESLDVGSEDATRMLRERMKEREQSKSDSFETIRKIFKVEPENQQEHLEQVKKMILGGMPNWLARLTITVVRAQGLAIRDSTGSSDPYVTVQVGKVKKRTKTVFQNLNPAWNETFDFECHNPTDKIKIRVWDEDDDLVSVVKSVFTPTSDDFLGQKVIDIRTLVGTSDLWYTLERRANKSEVSGEIRLRMTVQVRGEERAAPYHVQYTFLHETVFHHLVEQRCSYFRIPNPSIADDWKIYFDSICQEIIDEFAKRYGIESIFQAMTQFSCLCEKYANPEVPAILDSLLNNISDFYINVASTSNISTSEKLAASNFGKTKFVRIVDQLSNSLRIDLSLYRNSFPSTESGGLVDLEHSIDLLASISRFKLEVQGLSCPPKTGAIVKDCVNACTESTYRYLFARCSEMYEWHFGDVDGKKDDRDLEEEEEEGPGYKRNLVFWHKLITLLASTIDEDSMVYSSVLNRFPEDFTLEQLSSSVLWDCLCSDLKYVLEEHLLESHCKSCEYVNLHNRVNELYKKFVLPHNPTSTPPDYPLWFEPFIGRWMTENDKVAVSFAIAAYTRDKAYQFQKASKQSRFTCSVTDVFTQLTQCFAVVTVLIQPHPDVGERYSLSFSHTIENVILAYTALIQEDFPLFCSKPEITCHLMNNVQQLRIELEKLYLTMGGQNLTGEVNLLLSSLQRKINACLDTLVTLFCQSFKSEITEKVSEMRDLLARQGCFSSDADEDTEQRNALINESNVILSPLISYLDISLSAYARHCDKKVLKRLLKELWRVVLKELETCIILPSETQCNSKTTARLQLNSKQCLMLELNLDTLKQFFYANNNGLYRSYLERSADFLKLIDVLFMFTEETDVLIRAFVESQNLQSELTDEVVGVLNAIVEVTPVEGAEEHRLEVQVMEVTNIIRPASTAIFQPFVQVNVLGPLMSNRKRVDSTRSKTNTKSPKFNKTFSFLLGDQSALEFYELHITLRDYCFAREDKTIGVVVYQLRSLISRYGGKHSCRLLFKRSLYLDSMGDLLLKILNQRSSNEVARELVALKSESRSELDQDLIS